MENPLRGRGGAKSFWVGIGFSEPTETLKRLVVFTLLGLMLALGYALQPAVPATEAACFADPTVASNSVPGESGERPPAIADRTKALKASGALSPVPISEISVEEPGTPALPVKARNVLLGLAALGIAALGPVLAWFIAGGRQPEWHGCGSFRISSGFFRHTSDRMPFGRASGRRGGTA